MSPIIYHVCTLASWLEQKMNPYYEHSSLRSEGFIHCCSEVQLEGVLERYFQGKIDLLLLSVDVQLVVSDIRYERASTGHDFPHIFGSIEKAAIVNVEKIR